MNHNKGVGIHERHNEKRYSNITIFKNDTGYNKCGTDRCRKCAYWSKHGSFCDYLESTGTLRDCLPNKDCTRFEPRKKRTYNEKEQ